MLKKVFAAVFMAAIAVSISSLDVQARGTNSISHNFYAGDSHVLAIRGDGRLWAVGENTYSQLGDGATAARTQAGWVGQRDVRYIAVSASGFNPSDYHSFAIRGDGSLWGWGNNSQGHLGSRTAARRQRPVEILANVSSVSTSPTHTLAVTNSGWLYAWGTNDYGALGQGHTRGFLRPIRVMENVVAASAGHGFSMAITRDGMLYAFGLNSHGQLGDGTTTDRLSPVLVGNDTIDVAAGGRHTLAVLADGSLWAWGANGAGQIGDGTTEDRHSPVQIHEGVAAVAARNTVSPIAERMSHSLAITEDGLLLAWGWNADGQVGDGSSSNRLRPTVILDQVAAAQAGTNSSAAVRADGTLWRWGVLYTGRSGDGIATVSHSPILDDSMDEIRLPSNRPVQIRMTGLRAGTVAPAYTTDYVTVGFGGHSLTMNMQTIITDTIRKYPLLETVAAFGGSYSFNEETQMVAATLAGSRLSLTIGNEHFYLNDARMELQAAPVVREGQIFVPVPVITALGMVFEYQEGRVFAENLKLIIHGTVVDLELPVVNINGEFMYPLREVVERMGGTVRWNAQTRTATAHTEGHAAAFTLGSNSYQVNGRHRNMTPGVMPFIFNDRTFVPIRYIVESLGYSFRVDATQNAIIVE